MLSPKQDQVRMFIVSIMACLSLLLLWESSFSRAISGLTGEWAKIPIPGKDSFVKQTEPTGLYLRPNCWWGGYPQIYPSMIYPNHWWLFTGVSDTIDVEIQFVNHQGISYSVSGSPEQWLAFSMYTKYIAASLNDPIKSGSEIGSQFIGWKKAKVGFVTQPTSIPPDNKEYSMLFTVWNLPENTCLLQLNSTLFTPFNVTVTNWLTGPLMVAKSKTLADTLNTFFQIGERFVSRDADSIALQWADSILVKNTHSIIGWMLKYKAFDGIGYKSEALRAIDQTLWIMKEGLDPLIPIRQEDWDQNLSETEYDWIDEMYERTTYFRMWVESNHTQHQK